MLPWQAKLLSLYANRGGGAWTPPSGLLGWWYGSNMDGSDWADMSGNGAHLALTGGGSPDADGLPGGTYGYTAGIGFAAARTVAFWLYQPYAGSGVGAFRLGSASATSLNVSGMWGTTIYADYTSANRVSYAFGDNDAWVHVAVSCASTRRDLWRNGTSVANSTDTLNPSSEDGCLVGRAAFGALYNLPSGARIDDAMVFGRALSESEIVDIYANSPGSHAA